MVTFPQAAQGLAPGCPQYPTQTGPRRDPERQLPGQPEGERHEQTGLAGPVGDGKGDTDSFWRCGTG